MRSDEMRNSAQAQFVIFSHTKKIMNHACTGGNEEVKTVFGFHVPFPFRVNSGVIATAETRSVPPQAAVPLDKMGLSGPQDLMRGSSTLYSSGPVPSGPFSRYKKGVQG